MFKANHIIAQFLIVSVVFMGLPIQLAHAEMIPTEKAETTVVVQGSRDRIEALLGREEVRAALVQNGVSMEEAKGRIAALSDDEINQLAGKLDALPAGGDIIGVAFVVFVILLITDILGLTKVFSFTRTAK